MAVVLNSKFTGRTFVRAVFFMPVIFNSQAIDLAVAARSAMSDAINSNAQTIFDNMFSFKDFLLKANLPTFAVTFLGDASTKIYDIISFSGIQILIFLSAIQSVPKHLYEAAKMEGATQYEMFWKITFPMVSPMLLTSAVYTIIDSYTRSPMIKALTKYSTTGTEKVKESPGLTGKALELYNMFSGEEFTEFNELSKYGIGAGLSLLYSVMVILIIVIVLGILSKAVFYYDN
jgi:ABC-type sugar transport system permease subunit